MSSKIYRVRFYALGLALLLSLVPASYAQQPQIKKLPPINYTRSRNIDVKHIAIDIRFDWDKEQTYGTTIVKFAPFKDTNKITLDAAEMLINSVTLPNGSALKFTYDGKKEGDQLEITLDRVYKRGEDVSVKVDYRTSYVNKADIETAIGNFGKGLRYIKPTPENPNKPRQIWSQGETEFNRYWFPSYDSPNDFRTSELRATVEKPFSVISNGKLMEVKENSDNTRTFYWKMDVPYSNYLTSIVVGEYAEIKGEYDGIPVISYGYPSQVKEVTATVKNLPDMVKFYSEKTGVKYPYPKYAQTFVEDFGGGMENISATTMLEPMILDERSLLDGGNDGLQAHELAHQWFGDFVTTRDWANVWLNESFATYFDALYNEHSKGHDEFLYFKIRNNQQQYYNVWNQGNRRPVITRYYADKDALFDTYTYPRGASVLHMLRKHLGDDQWWKVINYYLTTKAHQNASTEEFRIAIEHTTGQSMDWFFDQWLYKMGHPIFEVSQNYDESKKQLTLNVKQTQKTDPNNEYPQADFFQTNVDIEIGTSSGTRIEKVWIEPKAENVFTFNVDSKPNLVNFDYEGTLIKEMKFDKPVDELVYQALNDKDVISRRWALGELGKKGRAASGADREKIMAALLSSAEKDSYWRLRQAAIGEIRPLVVQPAASPTTEAPAAKLDDALTRFLLNAAKDQQSLIRADSISLLGTTRDPKYVDLYLAALNDQSYTVIDQASLALAATKDAKAYDAILKLTNMPSWRGRIQIAGLNALAQLADKRAFDTGYKIATDKNLLPNIRTSALAVIGATGKGDSRAYPLISEQFKLAITNNDFQGIFNGIQAIVRLADPRGQEAFDLLKEKFKGQANFLGFINNQEAQFKASLQK